MQEVFEKIIDKLEERTSFLSDCTKYGNKDAKQQKKSYSTMMMYEVADLVDDLMDIVKQEAGQYNNGWIPCSERLPEEPNENPLFENKHVELYLVTTKYGSNEQDKVYPFRAFWNGVNFTDGWNILDVIAWQPLPEEYKEGDQE